MINRKQIDKFSITQEATIKEVLIAIEANQNGIIFVIDNAARLIGSISDGDIRRFLLTGRSIDIKCQEIMNKKFVFSRSDNAAELIALMKQHKIRHIPILDEQKKLISISISDKFYEKKTDVIVVIMAGGEGTRLKAVTGETPKPLFKIQEKAVIEEIIENLAAYNMTQIYMALNYKAEEFIDFLGDGKQWGVEIKYLMETKKLGTAGALSLLPEDLSSENVIVMNADILTKINFTNFLDYHKEHHAWMTVTAKEYMINIPFGVFEVVNGYLVGVKEKPVNKFFCNTGIYALTNEVLKFIPKNKQFDMIDLINILIVKSYPIGIFPVYEYWIDIGSIDDYQMAKKEYDLTFKRKDYA